MTRLRIPLCVAALALLLVGCSPSERRPDSSHTLRLYYSGNETVFSPADWVPFRQLVFTTLLRRGADSVEGWLVDEWSASADLRTWTYHIRDNAFWHDGVPVTTADIAYSLDLLYNPPVRQPLEPHFELEILSDKTFRVRYLDVSTKNRFEHDVICFPKHQLEALEREGFWYWDFWKAPIGNGPFRYVRHEPDVMMKLAADPAYFLPGPSIDTVLIRFGGNPLTELLAGNIDMHVWASAEDIPKFRHNPDIDHTLYGGSVSILYWNHARPLFADVRARRALTMAIDRRSLLASRGLDLELPVVDAPVEFLRRPLPAAPIAFDPAAATRLLRELDWSDEDDDGVLDRDGSEFRFELLVKSENQAGEAVVVQAQLKDIGVVVDIVTLPSSTARDRVRTGDFDAVLDLGRDWRWFIFGEALEFRDPSRPSIIGYDHAEVYTVSIALLDDFADDATERFDRRIWEIFQRDVPATVVGPYATVVAFDRRIEGLEPFRGFPYMDHARLGGKR